MVVTAHPRRELASVVAWHVRVWQKIRGMHHIRWTVKVVTSFADFGFTGFTHPAVVLETEGWADGEPRCYRIWTKDGFSEYKEVRDFLFRINPKYDLWRSLRGTLDSWAKVEWDARGFP
jgi:hypothetical protein